MTSFISIGTGNFYYWNISLLEKLRYLESFSNISGIEISCKPHWSIFSSDEIFYLSKYSYNTVHLWKFDKTDKEWMKYCIETVPNFQHFVVHPDSAILDDISKDIEWFLSFENMDTRKKSYKTSEEMKKLFTQFPKSNFTFDINHADENNIERKEFWVLQAPRQIHFSTVNNNFYPNNSEIDTPHALAHLNSTFNRKIGVALPPQIIVTLEGVFPVGNSEYIKREIEFAQKCILEN